MTYRIELAQRFEKSLKKLPSDIARRILNALRQIETLDNPRQKGKPLQGNLKGLWRYRVGDYRIICDIQDDVLVIIALDVSHRSSIYK